MVGVVVVVMVVSAAEMDVSDVVAPLVGRNGAEAVAVVVVVTSWHPSFWHAWPFRQHPPPFADAQLKKPLVHVEVEDVGTGAIMIVVGDTTVVVTVFSSPLIVTVVVYPLVTMTVVPLSLVSEDMVVGLIVPVVAVAVGKVVVTVCVP